ncbi:fatty acyl-CoA reductase wat-like isoform X1 [Bacillus rossius redtenbacheri]|uniref:fatty acyl-CoA reductase wat-like isoform X1 n=1 Tax=Bacillus rossius redtenbacheri TaxID=93214 RepID=UPI002FDE10D3
MSAAGDTEVQGLYRDCGVLVTGATGFLGKLTIEKILRSCPGVRTVYALVRPKRGISVDQRKKIVLDNVVFDRMKRERPDSVDKIVFVAGDCSSPRLGLSDSDYHHLTQHVNIVLHLAATVRFDEHLKVAVDTNVKGTMEVIALCHDCVSLKAAVFVSTAYSNCPQDVIKEEFYEPPMSVEETLAMLNKFTEHELAILSPKLIEPWPNTYVFSKAIAENVVLTQRKDLPVAIVRPSMVISTLKEPIMGWVDNMYGPIAIAIGVGLGMVRVIYSSEEVIMDIIPADMVTNCVIVSALATNTGSQDDIPVYNVTTSEINPVTVGEFGITLINMIHEYPFKRAVWYPFYYLIKNFYVYMFLNFFLHFLPGCLLDLVLRLKGKKPMILKAYRKILQHSLNIIHFSRDFTFISKNFKNLYEELSSQDKELFAFDTKEINWNSLFKDCGREARIHLLNESLDSFDEAKSHQRKFFMGHTLMKIILFGILLYGFIRTLNFFALFKWNYINL